MTRRASRYCCAALDRSRWSWRRGMGSGYGTRRHRGRRARLTRAMTTPIEPGDERGRRPGAPTAETRRSAAPPDADRNRAAPRPPRAARSTAAAATDATAGTSSRPREDGGLGAGGRSGPPCRRSVAAKRPQPVSSPTSQPIAEGDRQPADDRADDAPAQAAGDARSVRARPRSVAARSMSGGGTGRRRRAPSGRGGRRLEPGRAGGRRGSAGAGRGLPPRVVVWVGPAPGRAAGPVLRQRPGRPPRPWRPGQQPGRGGRGAGAGAARLARPRRPTRAGLVLRSVLARVGVFLRVDGPVRPARRPVPARAAPVGLERLGIGPVVRGGAERGLVRLARDPWRPGPDCRSSPAPRAAARSCGGGPVERSRGGTPPMPGAAPAPSPWLLAGRGPRGGAAARPAAVRPMRRVAPVRIGLPRLRAGAARGPSPGRRRPAPPVSCS